eukprot:COSAG03_NODE_3280_length_2105_cov_3.293619_4_plen_44_part_01
MALTVGAWLVAGASGTAGGPLSLALPLSVLLSTASGTRVGVWEG